MSADIHRGAKCFLATINNQPAGFCAVLHFPHGWVKNFKRVSRLVVLPDYQGIGLGNRLMSFVGDFFIKNGFRFIITTSTPALMSYFSMSKEWVIKRVGRSNRHKGLSSFGEGSTAKYTLSAEKIKTGDAK